jgi:1-deoxy-D-xylulose-5-phosphate reductoisomerase
MSAGGLPRSIAVLGSTGSVGRQALSVAAAHGLRVDLLTANRDVQALEEQVRRFHPRFCAVGDETFARELSVRLSDTGTRVLAGEAGICEGIAASDAEVFVNAIVGKAGLMPTLAVIDTGRRLALSNKESLVIAGEIVMRRARERGCEIIPVDSEHSAIFQCLQAGRKEEVKRILLTASGGPFYGYSRSRLARVTLADTLRHPTWKMGAKITVDSATLMNKGFEVIEAVHLFGVKPECVQVLVHRESIIHSAVEYIDHTVIAELSKPDMRACIQYALTYPARVSGNVEELDLFETGRLTFAKPDTDTFPLLTLAMRAIRAGGALPAVLNAANEVAVAAFLDERLSFLGISEIVSETVERLAHAAEKTDLASVLAFDQEARSTAASLLAARP